jgi:hypothetical protein
LEGAVTNTKELFDAMKFALVLQGLPMDYDHMVTNISGAGNKTLPRYSKCSEQRSNASERTEKLELNQIWQ